VPTEALGHAGVGDKRNGLKPMSEADEESFRILRQNVRYLAAVDPLRTLLVTSASAQEGKSTVAACLAAAAAGTGKRTLLVECDLRRPVLAARLGVAEKPGLTDYLTGNAEPNQILQAVPALAATTNGGQPRNGEAETASDRRLVCITAGTLAPRPADLLASERFQAFLAEVSDVYETVILDTAPLLTVADTLEIVPHVAGVLVCVRLRQTRRDQLRSTQAALDRLPVPPVGLVLTDVREAAEGYYGYYGAPIAAGKA
jgi:capsular exopolysaccharide synthesis family protein